MKIFYLLFLLVTYSTACLGAGALLLKVLPKRQTSISAGTLFATSFIIGQGLLASLWLVFSLCSIFNLFAIIPVLVIGIACFILFLRQRIRELGQQLFSLWLDFKKSNWIWKIISGLTLVVCLVWITSIGRSVIGDGSAFYFSLPKVIAASHRLVPLPGYNSFMYVGLQGEMHFAALMALGSPEAAQLFSWPTIIAGAILLLALGRQTGLKIRGQWVALAMVFTSSCVIWLSGDGKTDLFAVAFGLAAYYWTMQIWMGERSQSPWLAGLFAGFAVVAKFSYIPVMLPGIALLVCWGFFEQIANKQSRKTGIKSFFITSGIILLGFILAMIPHMIKNTLLFHNPIAPFGLSSVSQVWFGSEITRRILLTYPLALTFGSYWAQYGTLSPLLLAFIPLAFILPRPRSFAKSGLFAITITALLGLIIWMVSQPSVIAPRYFMATLLLFILLPANAVEALFTQKNKYKFIRGIVLFSIFGTLITTLVYFNNLVFYPGTLAKTLGSNPAVCSRDGEYCKAMEAINADSKPGTRVYLGTYYRYWLRSDLIQCLNLSTTQISGETSEKYWESFYKSGFNYLLTDSSIGSIPYLSNPPSWLKLTPLFKGDIVSSYRLDVSNPPVTPDITCTQEPSGGWDVVSVDATGNNPE